MKIDENKAWKILQNIQMMDVLKDKDRLLCPFCRSHHYFISRHNYLCQDCDACGDIVSYTMNDQQCSYDEAISKLWGKFATSFL